MHLLGHPRALRNTVPLSTKSGVRPATRHDADHCFGGALPELSSTMIAPLALIRQDWVLYAVEVEDLQPRLMHIRVGSNLENLEPIELLALHHVAGTGEFTSLDDLPLVAARVAWAGASARPIPMSNPRRALRHSSRPCRPSSPPPNSCLPTRHRVSSIAVSPPRPRPRARTPRPRPAKGRRQREHAEVRGGQAGARAARRPALGIDPDVPGSERHRLGRRQKAKDSGKKAKTKSASAAAAPLPRSLKTATPAVRQAAACG